MSEKIAMGVFLAGFCGVLQPRGGFLFLMVVGGASYFFGVG